MIPRPSKKAASPLRRKNRVRDRAYMAWIREQPCIACSTNGFAQATVTECAHVGLRGLGTKCPDRQTLPLCVMHHRTGKHAHHVLGRTFWEFHKLDRDKLIALMQKRYETRDG